METGLGDFSFDWILVQNRVAAFTRICTYDRAGYAWSDPGPKPRTFTQLNLELRDALSKLGEHAPFVFVGHSYGGPVVRNLALEYPKEVGGIIFVDSAFEGQRVGVGGKKTIRLGEDASRRPIPPPHEAMKDSDKPAEPVHSPAESQPLDPLYSVLPSAEQKMHVWAQSLPQINDAEDSQREWSSEYFARWLATSQAGKLGSIPVLVLMRAEGGYPNDLDIPAAHLEAERKQGQAMLAALSTNSKLMVINKGHNMEVEAPDEVTAAIRGVVEAVRHNDKLR